MSQWEAIISRQLRALHLGSIRSNILVFAVLATLTPTLVTSLVSYRQNRQLLTEQIAGELRSVSSEAARELDLWLNGRLDDLRAAASSYVTSENRPRSREEKKSKRSAVSAIISTRSGSVCRTTRRSCLSTRAGGWWRAAAAVWVACGSPRTG